MTPQAVVHGTQRGGMSPHRARRVLKPQALFLRRLRAMGVPVLAVTSHPRDGGVLPELARELDPGRSHIQSKGCMAKNAFDSGVREGPASIPEIMRSWGARKLIIFGVNRSMCVKATVKGAAALGYQVHVPDRLNDDPFLGRRLERHPSTKDARALFRTHHFYPRSRALLEVIRRDLASL